jgi:hypothetical protein
MTVRNVRWAINRRGAHVSGPSWSFLAHFELICDPPTHSLTLLAWDCILVRDWELHRLVTLGGCRLLDGSGVVSVELSKKIVEESLCRLWGVRVYLPGAAKATLVETRYWVISCPLGSKIKLHLDRGASESLKSTSTWIRGDQQITDTTG